MALPENTEPKDWFPFFDGIKLTAQWYVYYIFEHLGIIILSYLVAVDSKEYRIEVRAFFWLMVANFADFLLCYNTPWFHIGLIPISMNILSTSFFGILIFMAWIRTQHWN
jgi:hypothetical protein